MAADAAPVEPSPQAPATPIERWDVPGSDVGFWCHKVRQKSGTLDSVGACYRAKEICQRLRQQGLDRDFAVTECKQDSAAHCFTMADLAAQKIYSRCFDTDESCQVRRGIYKRDQPKFEFTACSFTASRWPEQHHRVHSSLVQQ